MSENIDPTMPGGAAAHTPNFNLNPSIPENPMNPIPENPIPENSMESPDNDPDDPLLLLKTLAERFECYVGTLKNNVKNKRLPAYQENSKAPYMAKASDTEKLLRASPGIASKFFPAASPKSPSSSPPIKDPALDLPLAELPAELAHLRTVDARFHPVAPPTVTARSEVAAPAATPEEEPTVVTYKEQPGDIPLPDDRSHGVKSTALSAKTPTIIPPPAAGQTVAQGPGDPPAKKRNRRGRRKRHGSSGATESPALELLEGTTPKERLKLVALLNDLASLVASA